MTMNDPVIDEVRRVRRQISNEVGSDLDSLISRYRDLDKRFERPALIRKDRRTIRCTGAEKSSGIEVDNQSSPPRDR